MSDTIYAWYKTNFLDSNDDFPEIITMETGFSGHFLLQNSILNNQIETYAQYAPLIRMKISKILPCFESRQLAPGLFLLGEIRLDAGVIQWGQITQKKHNFLITSLTRNHIFSNFSETPPSRNIEPQKNYIAQRFGSAFEQERTRMSIWRNDCSSGLLKEAGGSLHPQRSGS